MPPLRKRRKKVQDAPDTALFYASLLSNVDALMIQQSRVALEGTDKLLSEALRSNPDRNEQDVAELIESLKDQLITRPSTHSALFGMQDAKAAGLPVIEADLHGEQWQLLWRLWAKYYALGATEGTTRFYEGGSASQILNIEQ